MIGVAWLNSIAQRLDDLDLALGEPVEHRRQLGHRAAARPCIRTPSLLLPRVVQLELVVLGDDLFGQRDRGVRSERCAGAGSAALRRFRNSSGTSGLPVGTWWMTAYRSSGHASVRTIGVRRARSAGTG